MKKPLTQEAQRNLERAIQMRAQSFDESTRDVAHDLMELHNRGDWQQRRKPGGGRFATFREYLGFDLPYGAGINQNYCTLSLDGIASRIAAEVSAKHPVLEYLGVQVSDGRNGSKAGNQKARKNKGENKGGTSPFVLRAKPHGTADQQRLWLQLRHPAIWKRLMAGKFASVHAAMTAAGVGVKHGSHLDRCRRSWNCMSAKERRQFLAMVAAANNGNVPA